MTLRDDMTLAEAQAEAQRRWPGVRLMEQDVDTYRLYMPGTSRDEGGHYSAYAPVGCLDQAIAAEARRDDASRFCRKCGGRGLSRLRTALTGGYECLDVIRCAAASKEPR